MKTSKDYTTHTEFFGVSYKGNAKLRKYYAMYREADNNGELWQVYESFSEAKTIALKRCKDIAHFLDGYTPKIITSCTCFFTYGFLYEYNGKEYFALITPTQNISAPVDVLSRW